MERKKKYHGGLFLFFATLFALLFINTFSYAGIPKKPFNEFDETIVTNIFDMFINMTSGEDYFVKTSNKRMSYWLTEFKTKVNLNTLANNLNNNIDISKFDYFENMYCILNYNSSDGHNEIIFIPTQGLGHPSYLHSSIVQSQNSNYFPLNYYYIEDNHTRFNFNYLVISWARQQETYYTISTKNTDTIKNSYLFKQPSIDSSNDVIYMPALITFENPIPVYYKPYNSNDYNWYFTSPLQVLDVNSNPDTIPSGDISPGTGTITNPSGDVTGQIDLSGIEQGIGDINNNLNNIENKIPTSGDMQNVISGEVGKITNTLTESADNTIDNTTISSGDIVNSLGFTLMENPYQNFWFSMTQGLSSCLTDSVRSIPVNWLGFNGYFNLDGLINYPSSLKTILTTVSTVAMVWWLVKWWKIIIDKLTSGNVEEVLEMNEEERHY